jgi:SSS family solute:Na+ symporter
MISGGGLYQYLQSVQGYLAPPIAAVFLLGIFWSRINSRGAVWGLASGFILGMLKITVQAIFGHGKVEHPAFLAAIGDFNFLYFTGVLFAISIVVVIVASFTAPPPGKEKLIGLTYASATDEDKRENRASWGWPDVLGTAVVLGGVLGMYLYFSFWLK